MQKQMTEDELHLFAFRVFRWRSKEYRPGDPMPDIAFYILDLLRQGCSVNEVLVKLAACSDLCRAHGIPPVLKGWDDWCRERGQKPGEDD